MKILYDEAKAGGHWVARFCAAGLLVMIENPKVRQQAINRLREWEEDYADASPAEIRDFVQGAESAMQSGARAGRPARSAPRARKKAAGGRS